MKQSKLAYTLWLQGTIAIVTACLLPSLLLLPGPSSAEQSIPSETIAIPQGSTELRTYKQRFDVTADVQCRIPKKGASTCRVNIGSEIEYQLQPEMILKYTSIRLDEQDFVTEVTPQGFLQFPTNKVDYSGAQTFEVEIIYLK